MNIVFGVIIGLLILMFLVTAHEFGHFIAARKNGVKVNEFGIGFPPRAMAWVKKKVKVNGTDGEKDSSKPESDTDAQTTDKWVRLPKSEWQKPQKSLVFSLNFLPIGGFCSMDGESAADKRKGTFGAASFWAKTQILFAGVLMNWLVAFVLLTVLAFTGMPQFIDHQFYLGQDAQIIGEGVTVVDVLKDSPAEAAGFQVNDKVLRLGDGTEVFYPDHITAYGQAHAGQEASYVVLRGDEEVELTAQLNEPGAGYTLGIQMSFGQSFVRSTWSAPIVGAGLTLQLTGETFKGLGQMLWNLGQGIVRQFSPDDAVREEGRVEIGTVGDSVSGPVGIVGVIFPAFINAGAANLAFLAALISVSLACMNVLPIPALDGGRWILMAIYKLRRKELTKETEEKIVSRAFLVLLGLIVLITILDILKLF